MKTLKAYRRNPAVQIVRIDSHLLLVSPGDERMYRLDGPAAELWNRLGTPRALRAGDRGLLRALRAHNLLEAPANEGETVEAPGLTVIPLQLAAANSGAWVTPGFIPEFDRGGGGGGGTGASRGGGMPLDD